MICPGYTDPKATISDERSLRITCEGSASEYHRHPAHPHLFCGCGKETEQCHPGRCCRDDDWGRCANCGRPSPMGVTTVPEETLSEPLFQVGAES